jgi:hypothetical protein
LCVRMCVCACVRVRVFVRVRTWDAVRRTAKQFFLCGCSNQYIRLPFVFKGLVTGSCYFFGADSATQKKLPQQIACARCASPGSSSPNQEIGHSYSKVTKYDNFPIWVRIPLPIQTLPQQPVAGVPLQGVTACSVIF